jgi:GT2 family glycosyltransferase
VTVAVVSWNTREHLIRCLGSLEADVQSGRADVWVIDNASSDGSPDAAREAAPWAEVLDAGDNLGFGRAVNLVARRTQSDWLMAANADVELEAQAMSDLLDAGSDPRVGCVAPRLILPDGTPQHSAYPFPTGAVTAYLNLGLPVLTRSLATRLCLEGFWDPDRSRDVPWAIGALLLLRREAFDAVGGFGEDRWLYAEDLDLGWRLHDAGWTTHYEAQARVLHAGGAATTQEFGDEKTSRFMAATYATIRLRRGRVRAWATGLMNVAGAWVRLIWMRPLARVRPVPWQHRLNEGRRWLQAHRRARRVPAELLRP